jgi:hypothetical protein
MLAAILSFSALARKPSPFRPRIQDVEFVASARHCTTWVWDAGTPQLVIGMLRTGILPLVRIAYVSYTAASSLCCFAHNPLLLYDTMSCEACTVPCA